MNSNNAKPKVLTGEVVSAKMTKTVVVAVASFKKHPRYGKYIRRRKKFLVHNELGGLAAGDRVKIQETRPYSRHKTFKVIEKL